MKVKNILRCLVRALVDMYCPIKKSDDEKLIDGLRESVRKLRKSGEEIKNYLKSMRQSKMKKWCLLEYDSEAGCIYIYFSHGFPRKTLSDKVVANVDVGGDETALGLEIILDKDVNEAVKRAFNLQG